MDGIVNTLSTSRRSFLYDYVLKAGGQVTLSAGVRAALGSAFIGNVTTGSFPRRAFLTDYLLVGRIDTGTNGRRSFLYDYVLVGRVDTFSNGTNAFLRDDYAPGLYGVSFILSDRQIITQQPGLQGISMILSDRQIITQQPGVQGVSMILSDQQPFDFNYGMDAVLMEGATDEQWFEPAIGMKAIDIEIDFSTPRGYIIRK